jgi:hypothetical protein
VNTEHHGDNRTVKPGEEVLDGAWVPWCWDRGLFAAHHIAIWSQDGRQHYYVWQNGDKIVGSPIGFGVDEKVLGPEAHIYKLTVSAEFQISLDRIV